MPLYFPGELFCWSYVGGETVSGLVRDEGLCIGEMWQILLLEDDDRQTQTCICPGGKGWVRLTRRAGERYSFSVGSYGLARTKMDLRRS